MIENTVCDIVDLGSRAVLLQYWFPPVTAALPEPGRLVVLTENFSTLSGLLCPPFCCFPSTLTLFLSTHWADSWLVVYAKGRYTMLDCAWSQSSTWVSETVFIQLPESTESS